MKFGEMNYDVPFERIESIASGDFSFYETLRIKMEGKRLYKLYPKYSYLKEDPWIKTDGEFYKSVTYAYMVDAILNKYPKYQKEYKQQIEDFIKGWSNGSQDVNKRAAQAYSWYNKGFIFWYRDQLRLQADPDCFEREKRQREKELQESIAFHAAIAKMDAERHPHVECPYCHSTNTEKISTVSRAVSVSLVGAASGKIGKQWHCKQCGSNF